MNNKWVALFLFLSVSLAQAHEAYNAITASGGSPIPASFNGSSSQSVLLTGLTNTVSNSYCVQNGTGTTIDIHESHSLSGTPASTNIQRSLLPGFGKCFPKAGVKRVLIQGRGGTITSGEVFGDAD